MIKRTIKNSIINSVKNKPITLITGARQVGKSTLCYEIAKEYGYNYVTLDDLRERKNATEDPEMFLQMHPSPLIIDEAQYAPQLFPVLEYIVNKAKLEEGKNAGMFILTGSEAFDLMQNVTESMAGRISIIRMAPLSVSEINNVTEKPFEVDITKISNRIKDYNINVAQLYENITKGFYPELYSNPYLNSSKLYSDYVNTYINRDISKIINIKDKLKFQNFMEILASLTAEELIYNNLAKQVGVSLGTIQSWISALVSCEIIYLLQPYNEASLVKRVVKIPKIYFQDTGLACYLAKLSDPLNLKASYFAGKFVETYIINEIRKSYNNNDENVGLYYYRDSNQNEIDLIILKDGVITMIECKSGVSFNKADVKAFNILKNTKYKLGMSCIICNTDVIYRIKENVVALPISSI